MQAAAGHGLPTVPKVMGQEAEGRAIVGGVRFNMPGWWELKVHVDGAAGEDTATFSDAAPLAARLGFGRDNLQDLA